MLVPIVNTAEGRALDLGGIEAAFAAGARAYLLSNPHNPLGHPFSRSELSELASLAAKYDATIVSDEIHGPLTLPGATFVPFLSVSDEARSHGVCVTSASKAWNLAGLKCAIMVTASARFTELVEGLPEEVFYRTSQFGLIANVAAYTHGEAWLDGVIADLDRNRHALARLLHERLPGVRYSPPEASYLAWLDFRALGWGDDPSARALDVAKVALNSGPSFGVQGAGFARLNFACSLETLEEAVTRLAAADTL